MRKTKNKLPLRELNYAKTRYGILNAFLELFKTKSYDEITVDEICEIAEVSKGTFFNHLPTKEHILTFYQAVVAAAITTQLEKEDYIKCSSLDKIRYIFKTIGEVEPEYPGIINLLLSHFLRYDIEFFGKVKLTRADFIYQFPEAEVGEAEIIELPTLPQLLENVIQEGMQNKEIREDIDIRRTIILLVTICFGTAIAYKYIGEKYNPKEAYNYYLEDMLKQMQLT